MEIEVSAALELGLELSLDGISGFRANQSHEAVRGINRGEETKGVDAINPEARTVQSLKLRPFGFHKPRITSMV
jgi:hypothetical protein